MIMKLPNNILHVMGMDSTKYGGIERFNVELSRQLAEREYHSVFVYESMPVVPQFVEDLQKAGAELIVIKSRGNMLGFCKRFWQLLKQYNFCMMHAHFTKARFYAIPLALLCGIRNIVYTFHSTIGPVSSTKLHTRLWYYIFNKYCRIVAVSKDIEKVARKNWPDATVQNIYLGIASCLEDRNEARKALQIPDDSLMVMCTANFNHIKGLDILTKAIAKLRDSNALDNVAFYIVGQPDKDREELQQLAHELNVASYMRLKGISNQISQYLNAADVYIQPSRNEGLPISLMEACSVGLPIVASRVGGIPEVAVDGRNAILFDVANVDACAAALRRIINNVDLRKKYGCESKNIFTEKFLVQNNVQKLIGFYQLKQIN